MKKFSIGLLLSVSLLCLSVISPPVAHASAITITPANFAPSANAVYLAGKNFAGATLTAGQAVYVDTSVSIASGQIKLASVTGTGLSTQVIGFAANGAAAGQPVKVVIRDPSLKLGGAVTIGLVVVLGVNGAVNPSADIVSTWYAAVLGIGIDTTHINFGGTRLPTTGAGYGAIMRADAATP